METQNQFEILIKVNELNHIGLNSVDVIEIYRERRQKQIHWNDMIKVSTYEEGKSIKFETLDKISVIVNAVDAAGMPNKDGGTVE